MAAMWDFFAGLFGAGSKQPRPAGAPEGDSPAAAGPRRVARPEPPAALVGPYRKGDRIGDKYVVLGVLGAGGVRCRVSGSALGHQ